MKFKKVTRQPTPQLRSSTLAVLMISVMAGCTTPYKEPTNTPTATIEFVNDTTEKMGVQFYDDAKECTNRKTAGLVESRSQRKLIVPAGQSTAFTVSTSLGSSGKKLLGLGAIGGLVTAATYRGCTPTVDFVPSVGAAYIFRMSSDSNECKYQFGAQNPISGGGTDDMVAVRFTVREWIRPMGEAGPFCKK